MSEEQNLRAVFAAELRSARELHADGGMTQAELANELRVSRSTVSRLESPSGFIQPEIPALLDRIFGTDGRFQALYEQIESRGFTAYSLERLKLERTATTILEWSPTVVPGLLQTVDYAYALLRAGFPRASEAEVRARAAARIDRQRLLGGPTSPDLSVVVCESVIRRHVGAPETMRRQLETLLAFTANPAVLLQVLPLDSGAHALMDGSLSILTASDRRVIAYTESIQSGAIIEEPGAVGTLARSYDVLSATALGQAASARMIQKQLEAYPR
ncbi:helix-turn-helix transcriptional regulator [Streptomyces sp. CFMR 7]|uniref:helix-turn-helix domain-containing protein n=1 Tax=Streptomyces sp. CFMR 7 TaxID=1649184 RepID=UPI0011A7D436|nr:helix-turn-helix transcriptional regulator [Streptomyces sp. CFMR 7]